MERKINAKYADPRDLASIRFQQELGESGVDFERIRSESFSVDGGVAALASVISCPRGCKDITQDWVWQRPPYWEVERVETESARTGYERFRELFGHYPRVYPNHAQNADDIYWGSNRLDNRLLRRLYVFFRPKLRFEGENPESPYFWGDICKE